MRASWARSVPTADRWQQVSRIYHAALARDTADRQAFLRDACAGDEGLRREVESLLGYEGAADRWIEQPAAALAAPMLENSVPSSVLSGRQIGPYVIGPLLDAGGMGQVYRARDTKLGREVAIKILPPEFTADADRRARFAREARLLAALNHPHIAQIYGLEELDASAGSGQPAGQALVMELVPGKTLADIISGQGHGLKIEDALAIARQIADALDAAHAKGIVHRDLKPANIKVTSDGTVKVLDFGLAKVTDRAAADLGPQLSGESKMSADGTGHGVILGTAAYMSPEQARGQSVDKRTDVWAFGCVLFEILTGQSAFPGDTLSDTIARILEREPDWKALPDATPVSLRRLLQRCLRKDPQQRLHDIADARIEIDEVLGSAAPLDDVMVPPVKRRSWPVSITADRIPPSIARRRRRFPAIAVAAVAIAGLGGLWLGPWAPWRDAVQVAPMLLSIELGVQATLPATREAVALSADATLLAFAARERENEAERLYVRRLAQPTATLIPGTEGVRSPFFSADGRWVAFFADLKLKKVPVTGGAVQTLADAPNQRGGWWGEDDTIVFAPEYRTGLMRVSSEGGPLQPVTTLQGSEISHRFPQVLPGGKAVLYTASTEVDIGTGASLFVQPLPSGDRIVVQPHGFFGRYTASGHIVFMQDSALFAVPFDRQRLKILGPPRQVIDGVKSNSSRGSAQFAASEADTLAYLPGQNLFSARPIAWMDRQGTLTSLRAVPAHWSNPEFSPDGDRIAMDIRTNGQTDIFVYELARGTLEKLTSGSGNKEYPVWTRDGKRIVYRSFNPASNPPYSLSWERVDGTGEAQILTQSTGMLRPGSWHPTQNVLAFVAERPGTGPDVMLLRLEGDESSGWKPAQPTAWLDSAAGEHNPVFSYDGKWLAYDSNESGRQGVGSHDVYVRRFPGPGDKVMISSAAGERPSWSLSTAELVFTVPVPFRDYRRVLMVAPYRVEKDTFRPGKPRQWEAKGVPLRILEGHRNYALHPEGARVAIAPLTEGEEVGQTHVTLFQNFFDHLRRIAPGH